MGRPSIPGVRRYSWRWRDSLGTLVVGLLLAIPISGVLAVLLAAAHAADSAVPAVGWGACYPLVVSVRLLVWYVRIKIAGLDP